MVALGAALFLSAAPRAAAQAPATREYQIKAVFLFNFAQFVEWPAAAFASADSPIVIGVVGDDPFDGALDATVRGEKINDRPLVVRRYRRGEDVTGCHILFISSSESARLGEILAPLQNHPVLTVGDMEGFSLRGGMIRFLTENNRTRLRINLAAAKAAQLVISSKLLRPAEIVAPGKDAP